jgi:hypothetical protein
MNRAVPQVPGDLNPIARPGSLDMVPPRGPVEPVAPVVPFTPRADNAPRVAPTEPFVAPTTSTTLRSAPGRVVPPRVRVPFRIS